jgi:PTS system nitrogen regulatory IIA component
MPLNDLLTPESVIGSLKATNKKQALREIAAIAAALAGQSEAAVFETLLQRERLGSTGIGDGIAVPHGKLPDLPKLYGVFARLERPIEFEALDGEPVDLIFALVAPESAGADHLKALARVARVLREPGATRSLRATTDPAALYALLTRHSTPFAA